MDEEEGWFQRAPGLKNMYNSGYGSLASGGRSNGDLTALEVEGAFNTHTEFLPPVDQMLVLDRRPKRVSQSAWLFMRRRKCNPNNTAATTVNPSVVAVSIASFLT